jgi:hypothetical protein
MKKNYGITIIITITLILTMTSCKMFRDTEGMEIKSKYNGDNLIFKTNSKFTYAAYRIKDKDTLNCFFVNYLGDTLIF